jgi:hypothetical protein
VGESCAAGWAGAAFGASCARADTAPKSSASSAAPITGTAFGRGPRPMAVGVLDL